MKVEASTSLNFYRNGSQNPPPSRRAAFGCKPGRDEITSVHNMAENHFESGSGEERVWDEYDWERFLQQQDRKTEKYMELLEKYLDDPNRDQIIAREMGWHHLFDENGKDWTADLDNLFTQNQRTAKSQGDEDEDADDEFEEEDDEETDDEFEDDDDDVLEDDEDLDESLADEDEETEEDEETVNRYDRHPLYQAASALAVHVDQLFDDNDPAAQHPAAARLTTNVTLANVKLAAALTDDDVDELGMTIAYLKRALKAITNAFDAAGHCEQEKLLGHEGAQDLRARIFQVRDGIVLLMGHYRTEWRRRYGRGH